MAVLLVLASGTAVSVAVTDSGNSDAGANAVQETTTEVVETTDDAAVETTEAVGEETTAAADDGEDAAATQPASVSISEQESDGEQVVIDSVTMEEGGFVAIHDQTLVEENDAVGSVVGTSVYLEAGTHQNVTITLGRTIDETQTLVAMPHQDTNNNQVYDFVISAGEVDGPYTADGDIVVDQATVNVDGAAETEVAEETVTEDVQETTPEEPGGTTDVVEETTEVLTEEPAETTAAEETDVIETEEPVETTEEDVVETEEPAETTEAVDETEVVDETTEVVDQTTAAPEEPAGDQQQFVFKVEQMSIDRWSFVVGDEETPDRTETVSDISVTDRRVEINLTEMLQQQAEMEQQFTTQDPEQAQEQLEENLSGDLETVRFVIENVNLENVTLVVTAPADMELPEQPGMGPQMTTEEDDVVVETTEADAAETTEEDDVVVETTEADAVETTEEDVVETEEPVETTEEDVVETEEPVETTEEDVVETEEPVETTEEDVVETEEPAETTEAEAAQTTTAQPALDSFNVSSIDAPESASAGDTVTVSAEVTNPNEVEATQQVELRLDGDVVQRQSVSVAGNDQQTVTFELDTTGLSSGDYVHGVFTRDFGEVAVITVNEPAAETEVGEETTEVVGTETPDAEPTTEAAGIETTVVGNETTIEG